MKRRSFIEKIGAGSSAFLLGPQKLAGQQYNSFKPYSYGSPANLADIITKENQVILRFEIKAVSSVQPVQAALKVEISKGKLDRFKSYFIDNNISLAQPKAVSYKLEVNQNHPNIFVAWVGKPSGDTQVKILFNDQPIRFSLNELVQKQQFLQKSGDVQVVVNYLLDKEIAFLQPEELGIDPPDGPFSVAIMADTQGGDPETPRAHPTRVKIHNAFAEDSIRIINNIEPQPAFTLVLGDVVDNQGEKQHFVAMHDFLKRVKSPMLYAIGNHETSYQAKFTPGYNMEEFNNYFAAQKAMNGSELLLYSFNLGDWHFIIWPDPLRDNFWETHPHYFDWLEQDLQKHKHMPVMFMQHVPSHPIGIDPLINYAESVFVKRYLLDIISRHGNVKYVLSGHVHIPIKASFKTAVKYRGMKMINLPAAGYRPRAFGEEEWYGGPSQGVLIAEFNGKNSNVYFKTVTEEVYTYPEDLNTFDESEFPLWLSYKWQLPAEGQIRNGSFATGLDHWAKRFVYQEDKNPSYIMEVRKDQGKPALYLYSRKRDYDIPGQDRLPQTINHCCQAINISSNPCELHFEFAVDGDQTDTAGYSGAFIWIEGFRSRFKLLNMAYWVGKAFISLGDKFTDSKQVPFLHFQLPLKADKWFQTKLNLKADFEKSGQSFQDLHLDRLVMNLGTWNINDGGSYPFAVYFKNLKFVPDISGQESNANGIAINEAPEENKWWMNKEQPFVHIAGEHRYHMATK